MKKTQALTISYEDLVEAITDWLDASGTFIPMYGTVSDICIDVPLNKDGLIDMDIELTFKEEDTSKEDRSNLDAWLTA